MATITSTATSTSRAASHTDQAVYRGGVNAQIAQEGLTSTSKPQSKERKYNHAYAAHSTAKISCLSAGAEKTPSFVGFRNLMILMLSMTGVPSLECSADGSPTVVSNLRLIIENLRKYGVLVCVRCHNWGRQDLTYGGILYLLVPCHLFVAYTIELVAAQQAKSAVARKKKGEDGHKSPDELKSELRRAFQASWRLIALAHAVNATLNLVISSYVVYYRIHHPLIGTACELHAIIVWLKTCSYAFTNRDLRRALLSLSSNNDIPELYNSCPYPQNITLSNLSYFWWAPTLVYQPVYPRTTHIRWIFVAKRLSEVILLSVAIWIASAQYAAPLLQNSLDKMASLDFVSIAERLMKLSTISLFCWLAGFFAFFQSFLNALAEITMFGDREFYSDWWNAPSIRKYWTSWNKPVMTFMRRHIYAPLVGRGWPPALAQVAVFTFSGLLHELLVGVPTHNVICKCFILVSKAPSSNTHQGLHSWA